MENWKRPINRRGFTLLEVMLALAVFAFAMTALVGFHSRGYVNDARARRLTVAVELARSKVIDYQLDIEKEIAKGSFPDDKTDEGVFDKPYEDYRFRMELRKVELPMPPVSEENDEYNTDAAQQMMQLMNKQISEAVRELKLTISWKEMERERSFDVVTHITKM